MKGFNKNFRLCDITIHESRYINSGESSEPTDFTIEIEIGEYPESIDNDKVYLHVTKDGMKDILTQLDELRSKCGMGDINDILEEIVAMKEQIMLPEEWQDKVNNAFEPMNRAIDLLERGFDKKMELIDKRIIDIHERVKMIENIKVKGGKLVKKI